MAQATNVPWLDIHTPPYFVFFNSTLRIIYSLRNWELGLTQPQKLAQEMEIAKYLQTNVRRFIFPSFSLVILVHTSAISFDNFYI